MKVGAMEFKMSTSVSNSIFGNSMYRTDSVFLYKLMFEIGQIDIKKAVSKMFASLKGWNDTLEISVQPEHGGYTRTLFLTRDYNDRENGTVTIAKCNEYGHFGPDDRERVALNTAKKRLVDYINSFEFC